MSTCPVTRLTLPIAAALLLFPTAVFAQATVVQEVVPAAVRPATEIVAPQPEVSAAGQIIRTKQVDMRGTTEKVLVALLDLGNGQRQIVDLGPTLNFKVVPVNTGDQISVRGPMATLGQSSVLVATAAHIGSDDVFIKRAAPAAVAAAAPAAVAAAVSVAPTGYPVTEQILQLEGRIENIRMIRLRGSGAEHTIAEMVNRNGGIVVVDLGPPAALWRADLKAGQWITVRGQQMNINNRSVFLALEINKTGIPFLIDRHLVHQGPTALVP
jgi:hypothetical protein